MTNILSTITIGMAMAGAAYLGTNNITEDTGVSLRIAGLIATGSVGILLWIDKRFKSLTKSQDEKFMTLISNQEELKLYQKAEHERSKLWRLWAKASFQVINQKLKMDPLPLPDEETPT